MKVFTCKPPDRTPKELWHGSLIQPQRTQLQGGEKNIYSAAILKETPDPNQEKRYRSQQTKQLSSTHPKSTYNGSSGSPGLELRLQVASSEWTKAE